MQEIYLDSHATTRVDSRVVDAMIPWMTQEYGNAGSHTHEPGRRAAAMVEESTQNILRLLGTENHDLIYTSGATESIHLAMFGTMTHPRSSRRGVLIGQAEHRAVLDCGKRLASQGYTVSYLPVEAEVATEIGAVRLPVLEQSLNEQVGLVCLILGNNEIGTLQEVTPLARACHRVGALLHIDATQAVGKIPLDVGGSEADLVSFSAHKFYGPKGVGGLLVPRRGLRLAPQIVGGGQQNNLRSGTLNTMGILGMTVALQIAVEEMQTESKRVEGLRNLLWERLSSEIDGLELNGPLLASSNTSDGGGFVKPGSRGDHRLPGNLNVRFPGVEGQAIMLRVPELALSSGSACSSADPRPSHVLQAIGLSEDAARSSLRFGIGRFNTAAEIEVAAERIVQAYRELRAFVA